MTEKLGREFLSLPIYPELLPDGATLRLIVHKDRHKVRVPFEFNDVEIPPIPPNSDKSPAIDEEEEKIDEMRPEDPLLADMKVTAKATRIPGSTKNAQKNLPLQIEFEITGKAAAAPTGLDFPPETVTRSIVSVR